MDWFSWLSKTNLDPSLTYDYAVTFAHNELEEDDIAYFNHEFLQSMGISVAKHRLEILKIAREYRIISLHPKFWLLTVIKQAKNYLSKHIRVRIGQNDSALTLMPQRNYSSRWKASMLMRTRRLMAATKQGRPMITNGNSIPAVESGQQILMLTNGSPLESTSSSNSSSSPVIQELCDDEKVNSNNCEYWSNGLEKLGWETMFHDLKPT